MANFIERIFKSKAFEEVFEGISAIGIFELAKKGWEWFQKTNLHKEVFKKASSAYESKEALKENRDRALAYVYAGNYPNLRDTFQSWERRERKPYGNRAPYPNGMEDKGSKALTSLYIALCIPRVANGQVVVDSAGERKFKTILSSLDQMSVEERDAAILVMEYNWKTQAFLRFLESVDNGIHTVISPVLKAGKRYIRNQERKTGIKRVKIF